MFRLILVIIAIIITSYRLRADNIETENVDIKNIPSEIIQYIPGDGYVKCWELNEKNEFKEALGISLKECIKLKEEGPVKFYDVSEYTLSQKGYN